MNKTKAEQAAEYLIAAFIIIIFTIILIALIRTGKNMEQRQKTKENQNIEECKQHTSDVEWCYKQFYKPQY